MDEDFSQLSLAVNIPPKWTMFFQITQVNGSGMDRECNGVGTE